ncbi:MAG TPA: imidazole glycerol phosphate synthase subunit HisH [Steroidobacteraceae bacterium]
MSEIEVVIIENGGANLASLRYALDRLGARSLVSADPATVAAAPRVLLPGVGAAADAMARLRAAGLIDCIRNLRQPVLGICLGMQLLYARSEEGDTAGLGLFPGRVCRLSSGRGQPVPHMGWNTCQHLRESPLLAGLGQGDHFYFAHSYAAPVDEYTTAATAYGLPVSAVVRRQNFHGVQFHPERSAGAGARLLRNFLEQ